MMHLALTWQSFKSPVAVHGLAKTVGVPSC